MRLDPVRRKSHVANAEKVVFRRSSNVSLRSISRVWVNKQSPNVPIHEVTIPDLVDLSWYPAWLSAQRQNLPETVKNLQVQDGPISETKEFKALYARIWEYVGEHRGCSVDEVVRRLEDSGLFHDSGAHGLDAKRLVVFSILGWQSMIYKPEFNVCRSDELAIYHRVGDADSGLVYDTYTVPADLCDRPLYVLLKGFGNLLPARSTGTAIVAVESSKTAASWTALYPDDLNAHMLHTLMRVRFRWVDSLALHLDYERSSRTLSLFCFPSACMLQLQNRRSPIFAFASTELNSADPRADDADIAQILEEVILSFRLLFGQSAKSRRLFRYIFDGAETPLRQPDTFLGHLCCEKQLGGSGAGQKLPFLPKDRNVYYSARDFPVLRERIELLAGELHRSRPKSFPDLLRDRRDTLQFWTFWLVSIFGSLGIALSFVQVILQGIQTMQGLGKVI